MTTTEHLTGALAKANTLDAEVGALIDAARAGQRIGLDDLSHIRRTLRFVLTHVALAKLEAQREPAVAPPRAMTTDPECTRFIAEWKADLIAKDMK